MGKTVEKARNINVALVKAGIRWRWTATTSLQRGTMGGGGKNYAGGGRKAEVGISVFYSSDTS